MKISGGGLGTGFVRDTSWAGFDICLSIRAHARPKIESTEGFASFVASKVILIVVMLVQQRFTGGFAGGDTQTTIVRVYEAITDSVSRILLGILDDGTKESILGVCILHSLDDCGVDI
jgi:hypothetical protein